MMKRMIGLLMVMGLMVGIIGCGDDKNPVMSNQDLLVGTWIDDEGDPVTFRADGTFVIPDEELELEGTWSVAGDKLTLTYTEEKLREFFITGLRESLKEDGLTDTEIDEYLDNNDALIEETFDEFVLEDIGDLVFTATINSITDTELTTTSKDEDGEETETLTRKT